MVSGGIGGQRRRKAYQIGLASHGPLILGGDALVDLVLAALKLGRVDFLLQLLEHLGGRLAGASGVAQGQSGATHMVVLWRRHWARGLLCSGGMRAVV